MMNKEDILFTLSLIGFAVFYQLSCHTVSSDAKTIYYFAWLLCLIACQTLYRNKGKEKKEDRAEDSDAPSPS